MVLRRSGESWRVVEISNDTAQVSLADELGRFRQSLEDENRPPVLPDEIVVDETALRLLVAIRGKDDAKMRELCIDRTKGWTDAMVGHFSMELRESFRQKTGEEFALYPGKSLVAGDLAVVKCRAANEAQKKLNGNILVLHFCRTEAGWKNWTVRKAPETRTLDEHLAQARQWAAEWRDDPPDVDGIGDGEDRSEEAAVSTLSMIVTVVLNLIPAEMNAFTVEAVDDRESIHFDRQADGCWKATFDAGRESITYSVDGTKLTATDGGKPQTVDLAGHLGTDQDTDWSKLEELNFREGASMVIERDPEGLALVFKAGKKVEREEHRVSVRWMVTNLDAAGPDMPQARDGDRIVRRVQLPDADRKDVPIVLDLASGGLLGVPVEAAQEIIDHFAKLGKGDLVWDGALITLRGAKVHVWNKGGVWDLLVPEKEEMGVATYRLELPKRLLVTSAEGIQDTMDVSSGVEDGVGIEYQRGNVPPQDGQDAGAGVRGETQKAPERWPVNSWRRCAAAIPGKPRPWLTGRSTRGNSPTSAA